MLYVLAFLTPLPALVLALLFVVGIQVKRGGWWRVLYPVTILGTVLDWLLNFTWFALWFGDWPRWGEWTLSKRLPRLNKWDNWRGDEARALTRFLNWVDPSGKHVKD